jgi:hypothetical protein
MRRALRALNGALRRITCTPEFNVAVFALLLNFPWEVLQAPLFVGMANAPFVDVIWDCARASLGDVVIMLLAYGAVAAWTRDRRWVLASSRQRLTLFVATGVSITALIEWLATTGRWMQGWTYSPSMPVLPGLAVGLAPLLQWVLLPLLVTWFVRRQPVSHGAIDDE